MSNVDVLTEFTLLTLHTLLTLLTLHTLLTLWTQFCSGRAPGWVEKAGYWSCPSELPWLDFL